MINRLKLRIIFTTRWGEASEIMFNTVIYYCINNGEDNWLYNISFNAMSTSDMEQKVIDYIEKYECVSINTIDLRTTKLL